LIGDVEVAIAVEGEATRLDNPLLTNVLDDPAKGDLADGAVAPVGGIEVPLLSNAKPKGSFNPLANRLTVPLEVDLADRVAIEVRCVEVAGCRQMPSLVVQPSTGCE